MQNWIVSNMKTKLKKEITKAFKELRLSIDIKAHLKQVEFLDVTFTCRVKLTNHTRSHITVQSMLTLTQTIHQA